MKTSAIRIAGVIAVVVALAAVYWLLQETGVLATILDGAALRQRVVALGAAGPLAVIALMVLAIMVSPIPSAPIAVAAGAACLGATTFTGGLVIVCQWGGSAPRMC